jgi:hypothetical protein
MTVADPTITTTRRPDAIVSVERAAEHLDDHSGSLVGAPIEVGDRN